MYISLSARIQAQGYPHQTPCKNVIAKFGFKSIPNQTN